MEWFHLLPGLVLTEVHLELHIPAQQEDPCFRYCFLVLNRCVYICKKISEFLIRPTTTFWVLALSVVVNGKRYRPSRATVFFKAYEQ
jgi:hypothetical protein